MATQSNGIGSKIMFIIGWVLTILVALAMCLGVVFKYVKPEAMHPEMDHLSMPRDRETLIVYLELAFGLIYLFPRTAALGAILITAYMGGAVACHVRVGEPFYAPIIFAALAWFALVLRDARIRKIVPFCRGV